MRYYPDNEKEMKEASGENKPKCWMLPLLKLNPEYLSWGPNEDYMAIDSGWQARQLVNSWDDFGPWGLYELNEVVNFYF